MAHHAAEFDAGTFAHHRENHIRSTVRRSVQKLIEANNTMSDYESADIKNSIEVHVSCGVMRRDKYATKILNSVFPRCTQQRGNAKIAQTKTIRSSCTAKTHMPNA